MKVFVKLPENLSFAISKSYRPINPTPTTLNEMKAAVDAILKMVGFSISQDFQWCRLRPPTKLLLFHFKKKGGINEG